jgi:perosamine synthetase
MTDALTPVTLYEQLFDQAEADAVARCMAPARFNGNAPVQEFEAAFCEALGIPQAIAVANGSVALHLAMLAAGIAAGDEVIVPALTFVATANAVAYTGAQPVFADVDPATWQMGAAHAEALITPRTKALIAVHLYGHASPLAELRELADRRKLLLIEDCAEALGTTLAGKPVGIDADAAIFSFYKNKTITTGEGGMVITRHADWHQRMVLLKGQGVPLDRRFWHEAVGYNYRMTNLAAAIGVAQLGKLDRFVARKREISQRYQRGLTGLPLMFQAEIPDSESACWLISATAPDTALREALMQSLAERQIETRPLFLPLHRFPMYAHLARPTPASERISACGFSLPSWPGLSDGQIDLVIHAITGFFSAQGIGRQPGH